MEKPQRPPPPEQSRPKSSPLSILLALGVLALACVVLFFLTGGFFGLVMVIAGVAFAFAALHYLVWGWWLGALIRRDAEEEDDESRDGPFWNGRDQTRG
jgi:hypothetical protein